MEWLESALAGVSNKLAVGVGAIFGAALAFQRIRKMFQSDRKEALHEEAQIDVLQILREELNRLSSHCETLELKLRLLHAENIELNARIRELENRACIVKEPTNGHGPDQRSSQ